MITNILLPTTFPYVFLRNQTGATKQFNNSVQISFSNHGIIPLVQSVHMKNRLRFPCFNRFSPTIKKNNNKSHTPETQKKKNEKCTNLYEKYRIRWENLPSEVEEGGEDPGEGEANTKVGAKGVDGGLAKKCFDGFDEEIEASDRRNVER